ncbi:glycoside hydrolase superfamily [Fomitopsis serialis]|uniref:glycoside hydrolase superfamily n=1 Tax=Fomitopsis serialis TaxID=139415 RepID=UPI002008D5FA|nr:glycoside hydrolase superfamily [Neoantrodia serialis]KAH9922384.1 glycoside hydrolase superfamily [Neoantrodia serialis]
MPLKAFFWVLLFAAAVLGASYEDWQHRSIYQLVTDRFATSDGSAPACDTSARQYCNGTWQGVISRLDYIQSMGFDAIWISPVVANLEGDTGDGTAYHGYWTIDQTSLNEHFGTDGDLQLLSTTLHQRGMLLMVDVVVNHMAAPLLSAAATNASAPAVNYTAFTPFNNQSSFHPFCWITDYANQTDVEQCWLGDAAVPLADVDTEDPDVVAFFNGWIADLVKTYGIDGLRIDTVKHIRKDFWPAFAQSAGVWSIGEVLDGDIAYVANYTQVLDAVLDYPNFYPLTRGFQNSSGDLSQLAASVREEQQAYRLGTFMTGAFLENQDNPRFASLTTDQSDGVPILYYGQEQGYAGGDDPYNREALWLSGYEEDKPLVMHVRVLNAARKAAIAWNNASFLSTPLDFPVASTSQLAVSKSPLLALLANTGQSSSPSWSVPSTNYTKGEELIDVLSCVTTKVGSAGAVAWTGSSGMPAVLLPTSVFNASYCNTLKGDVSGNAGSPWVAQSSGRGLGLSVAGALVATAFTIWSLATWAL